MVRDIGELRRALDVQIFPDVAYLSRLFGAACGLLSEVARQFGKSFARRKLRASRFAADFVGLRCLQMPQGDARPRHLWHSQSIGAC